MTVLSHRERRDWLRLSLSENVGPITFHRLLQRYGAADKALAALPGLSQKGGLGRPLRLCGSEVADRHLERAEAIGARFVAFGEPDYPALLRQTDGTPPLLCIKGNTGLLQRGCVAIVGARNASAAGRKLARQLAFELAEAGHVVASGLARGIDTAAHEAALEAGTIAVLAGGLDVIYPPENEDLHRQIGERGLLVSEMMPGTVPRAEHFPRRNRIISGIANAVVVVEAALRSGSLITARYASEQGREVFAVPGSPLDPRCEGCNKLIRDGATLLMAASDVIEALARGSGPSHGRLFEPEPPEFEAAEAKESDRDRLLGLLSPTPVDVDDLIRESGMPAAVVTGMVLELELAGRLVRHPQGQVSRP